MSPYGGPGGIRTPVQDTFLFASYSNNLQCILMPEPCQPIISGPIAQKCPNTGLFYVGASLHWIVFITGTVFTVWMERNNAHG